MPTKKQKTSGDGFKKRPGFKGKRDRSVAVPRTPFTGSKAPKIFTLRQVLTGYFTSSAGGVIGQNIHVNDPSGCDDWTSLGGLFDHYKVVSCKVKQMPSFNVSPIGGGYVFAPVYVVYDADSTSVTLSIPEYVNYGNMKAWNIFKPNNYKAKVITATDNSVANAGMQSTYDPKYGMLLDVAIAANYQKGVISWYGIGLPASTNFGDLIVEYEVQFFAKR